MCRVLRPRIWGLARSARTRNPGFSGDSASWWGTPVDVEYPVVSWVHDRSLGDAHAEVKAEPAVAIEWRLGHRPSLDALRGIAVLLVLGGHTLLPEALGGAGVTLFFVLSGYLITALLIGEHV